MQQHPLLQRQDKDKSMNLIVKVRFRILSYCYLLGNVEAAKEFGNVLIAALPGKTACSYNAIAIDFIIN